MDCPFWSQPVGPAGNPFGGNYVDSPEEGACMQLTEYAAMIFKYYMSSSSNFDCDSQSDQEALQDEIVKYYGEHGYTGTVVIQECNECTPSNPCRFRQLANEAVNDDYTNGHEFKVGTDFHTFYNPLCFREDDPVPGNYFQLRCNFPEFDPYNYDQGYMAFTAFSRAKFYEPLHPDDWDSDGTTDMREINIAIPGINISASQFDPILNVKRRAVRTLVPTTAPTPTPSASICFEKGYTNKLEDIKYMGNGLNCRGGIKPKPHWPGGRTCRSPYIVCLPEENTPNQTPKDPFYSSTHQYTVDQCIYECAWDQRCRGFEFVPTTGSLGECNLIDDLPLEITNQGSYVYSDTDADLTGNGALCWQKEDYCNPFFEAEDLEQTMIDCYCPNNRKGFYTKKVKRTVANTRFCGSDADTDKRIQQAQANRMFHLCENWCLFNTFKPEQESWYWNPWLRCWREQYAGTGMHRSYCNRVIRNPDTIEQYFINERTKLFCDTTGTNNGNEPFTQIPTGAPSEFVTTWYLAQEEESCEDACKSRSKMCDEVITSSLGETASNDEIDTAFSEAGITCENYGVAKG